MQQSMDGVREGIVYLLLRGAPVQESSRAEQGCFHETTKHLHPLYTPSIETILVLLRPRLAQYLLLL